MIAEVYQNALATEPSRRFRYFAATEPSMPESLKSLHALALGETIKGDDNHGYQVIVKRENKCRSSVLCLLLLFWRD